MSKLTKSEKNALCNTAKESSKKYNKDFLNKTYIIITEDYSVHQVKFIKSNFIHLTGIDSFLGDSTFFNMCLNDTIRPNHIKTYQHHKKSTLIDKARILEKIHVFLHADVSTNLYLENLVTKNKIFPLAIRNDSCNACIAFLQDTPNSKGVGRSIRKATTSKNSTHSLQIYAVFKKNNIQEKADTIVYIKNTKDILTNVTNINNYIGENVIERLNKINR